MVDIDGAHVAPRTPEGSEPTMMRGGSRLLKPIVVGGAAGTLVLAGGAAVTAGTGWRPAMLLPDGTVPGPAWAVLALLIAVGAGLVSLRRDGRGSDEACDEEPWGPDEPFTIDDLPSALDRLLTTPAHTLVGAVADGAVASQRFSGWDAEVTARLARGKRLMASVALELEGLAGRVVTSRAAPVDVAEDFLLVGLIDELPSTGDDGSELLATLREPDAVDYLLAIMDGDRTLALSFAPESRRTARPTLLAWTDVALDGAETAAAVRLRAAG